MPSFGKHLDLLSINTIDKVEVCVTEFEVIQREKDADALKG